MVILLTWVMAAVDKKNCGNTAAKRDLVTIDSL